MSEVRWGGPELVCLSLVRKVHWDLLEELFLIDHENLDSLMTFVTKERKIYHQPEFGVSIIDNGLKVPLKVTGQRRYFLAICSLTKEHSVVAVQDLWIGYIALN